MAKPKPKLLAGDLAVLRGLLAMRDIFSGGVTARFLDGTDRSQALSRLCAARLAGRELGKGRRYLYWITPAGRRHLSGGKTLRRGGDDNG